MPSDLFYCFATDIYSPDTSGSTCACPAVDRRGTQSLSHKVSVQGSIPANPPRHDSAEIPPGSERTMFTPPNLPAFHKPNRCLSGQTPINHSSRQKGRKALERYALSLDSILQFLFFATYSIFIYGSNVASSFSLVLESREMLMKGLSSSPPGASPSLGLDTQGHPEISRCYSLTRPVLSSPRLCTCKPKGIDVHPCGISACLCPMFVMLSPELMLSSSWISTKGKPATSHFYFPSESPESTAETLTQAVYSPPTARTSCLLLSLPLCLRPL